jgi:hypothetical protein
MIRPWPDPARCGSVSLISRKGALTFTAQSSSSADSSPSVKLKGRIGQLHDQFAQVMQQDVVLQGAFGGARADLAKDISETRLIVANFSGKLDTIDYKIADVVEGMKDMRADIGALRDAVKIPNRDLSYQRSRRRPASRA